MGDLFEESELERTLLIVKECFVFRIPAKHSAAGHRAADWKDQVLVGKMKITSKGEECSIQVFDDSGKLFCTCPVRRGGPKAYEKVLDSSRYYALRIEDHRGRHANIGIGFQERKDSFDFVAALQDFEKEVEREQAVPEIVQQSGPSDKFALKEGETMHIKIKSNWASNAKHQNSKGVEGIAVAPDGSLQPPPDAGKRRRRRGGQKTGGADLIGGMFAAEPPATTAPPSTVTAPTGGGDPDDLLSF